MSGAGASLPHAAASCANRCGGLNHTVLDSMQR